MRLARPLEGSPDEALPVSATPAGETGQLSGARAPAGALRRLSAWTLGHPRWGRLVRYGATSGVSTLFSEGMLIGLTATATLGATSSALLANFVASVPSYLLSRYWIWPEAGRDRVGRQVGLYWTTSILSTAVSTAVTKIVAANIALRGTPRALVLGAAFLGTYGVMWFAKYLVYHRWLFVRAPAPSTQGQRPPSTRPLR